jgi:hypothetical protein
VTPGKERLTGRRRVKTKPSPAPDLTLATATARAARFGLDQLTEAAANESP